MNFVATHHSHTSLVRMTILALLLVMACLILARCTSVGSVQESPSGSNQITPPATPRPTQTFRAHHVEILEHLGHIDAMADGLATATTDQQREKMNFIVTFLKEHIAPHAADEERVLYPAVTRHAGQGNLLTEVLVYEHTIVGRWIAALEAEAVQPEPDASAFTRRAMHLVGLLRGHFEVEEQVLLPVLDRTMTTEQFQREVVDRMKH